MIKKIRIDQLRPGMHIHDLNFGWTDHPYVRNDFLIEDEQSLAQVRSLGIRELYIDTDKGLDVASAPSRLEVEAALERELVEVADNSPDPHQPTTLEDEQEQARKVHREANQLIRELMEDVRLGRQIDVERTDPVISRMVGSIFRNRDALLGLTRIRRMDRYTFEHSVNVAVLMTSFATTMKLSPELVHQIGVGALLHDIGKTLTPPEVLNKPGRLNAAEVEIIRGHVVDSRDILARAPGIPPVALAVAAEHHERIDGNGYPDGKIGDQISRYGRMAAIVDVYDAITSDRVYHKGMDPHRALRKLLEWSSHHLDAGLVQHFIRCVGIYPVGTLVRLKSQRLAVVVGTGRSGVRHPKVRLVLDIQRRRYLPPDELDLSDPAIEAEESILSAEPPERWGIRPEDLLQPLP